MGWAKNPPPEFRDDGQPGLGAMQRDVKRQSVLSVSSVAAQVDAVMAACEAKRMELPHVVHVVDRSSGLASVFGPFGGPLAASVFADRFVSDLAGVMPSGLAITVIPLEPAG